MKIEAKRLAEQLGLYDINLLVGIINHFPETAISAVEIW